MRVKRWVLWYDVQRMVWCCLGAKGWSNGDWVLFPERGMIRVRGVAAGTDVADGGDHKETAYWIRNGARSADLRTVEKMGTLVEEDDEGCGNTLMS